MKLKQLWATEDDGLILFVVGWAVLDTAAILPLLPPSAYIREGGTILLKADDLAKLAKTEKGKAAIKSAIKPHK